MKFITALEKYLKSRGLSYERDRTKGAVIVGTEADDIPVDIVVLEGEHNTARVSASLPMEINAAHTEIMITASNIVNAGTDFGKFSVSAQKQTLSFSGYIRLHANAFDNEISYMLGMTNAILNKFGKPLFQVGTGELELDAFIDMCAEGGGK